MYFSKYDEECTCTDHAVLSSQALYLPQHSAFWEAVDSLTQPAMIDSCVTLRFVSIRLALRFAAAKILSSRVFPFYYAPPFPLHRSTASQQFILLLYNSNDMIRNLHKFALL